MEQSFDDLFSGAFAEDSLPGFPEGDFNFESLNFDETLKEDMKDSLHVPSKDDEGFYPQPVDLTAGLSSLDTHDKDTAGSDDEQPSDINNSDGEEGKSPEVHHTSSGGDSELEDSVSGEEDNMGRESLLMSVHSSDESWCFNNEVGIFAEEHPLASEGAEKPQIRNEEHDERESEEEALYCGKDSESDGEVINKDDEIGEEAETQKESGFEGHEGKGGKALPQYFGLEDGKPYTGGLVTDLCDSPEISTQSLQELDADAEDYVEKIKDFSGDEHQEAGESFAYYPSDLFSCEYVEEGSTQVEKSPHQVDTLPCEPDSCWEQIVTDVTWTGHPGDTGGDGDEHLHSREMDADEVVDLDRDSGQRQIVEHIWGDPAVRVRDHEADESGESESDTSSSSEDDVQVRKSDEDFSDIFDLKQLEDTDSQRDKAEFSEWSICEDLGITTRGDPTVFNRFWDTDVSANKALLSVQLSADEENHEALSPDVNQHPREDACTTTKSLCPSNQGSVDDSFFFNTDPESSGITEVEELGDDECEDERNWEQEQERIEAFYKFYNDDDGENGQKGRKVKVQFSTDPLSQVIQYDSDSSDRDSLNSSTDGEEGPSSVETSEDMRDSDDMLNIKPAFGLPNTPVAEKEPDQNDALQGTRTHKRAHTLKLILRMGLVMLFGLLMFWMATDQMDWFCPISFF